MSRVCASCSTEGAQGTLQRCGRCKQALYCDRTCQKAHWADHKKACLARGLDGKPPRRDITFTIGEGEDERHYISLESPDEALAEMHDADEVVIAEKHIVVELTYPLSGTFRFKLHADTAAGFTRRGLVKRISDTYHQVFYRDEERTQSRSPPCSGFLINRGFSDGKYGIWGHVLGDLVLHTVSRDKDGTYGLGIDS
ncbi:hypothetical protein JKP88DRAFT_332877 [Tribonema minus]|uniref:MYND-type domain-containing protein n=1 Tax=Tribonema minus TaxID=303371 RepID=A0A836C979_9STRA|nr:hypothetical protein JKP88DRAFT_332877 [Tribonema minus]